MGASGLWVLGIGILGACGLALTGCAGGGSGLGAGGGGASDGALGRAIRLMERTPLIDGHNDLPWQYRSRHKNHLCEMDVGEDLTGVLERPTHTDIPRLRAGRVGAQFWSVYVPIEAYPGAVEDVKTVGEQIDVVRRLCEKYPDDLELALSADDVERIFRSGKIASLIGMEGGHSIDNSLATLRMTYELGARYMTITHSLSTAWADSATDVARHGGLTAFGREVVREMNRLGMLVDLSHVSAETMHDALDVSESPVIFSHSSARALTDHARNVPDDVLERVRENGGVVMVTFVPSYVSEDLRRWGEAREVERARLGSLHGDDVGAIESGLGSWARANPQPRATLADVADHIEHVARVAGIDHVGIGGDYDGITSLPEGLEDVSTYPALIAELIARGWSDGDVRKLLGENVLRVMRENERVAARLRAERGPSDVLIEEVDAAAGGA